MATTSSAFITILDSTTNPYPIAGQDNDTQGFRDRYSATYNALSALGNEVSVLQATSVNKTTTNDFGQNVIENANLQGVGQVAVIDTNSILTGAVSGTQYISYASGNYIKRAIASTTTFQITGWPDIKIYASVKLELTGPETANTQTVQVLVTGTSVLVDTSNVNATNPIVLNTTSSVLYEISTTDGGETQFVRFLGGPFE
jgi:hypothetical protein